MVMVMAAAMAMVMDVIKDAIQWQDCTAVKGLHLALEANRRRKSWSKQEKVSLENKILMMVMVMVMVLVMVMVMVMVVEMTTMQSKSLKPAPLPTDGPP
jgi:heme/copper-type cytochrome/quinol oxidase subunit 2